MKGLSSMPTSGEVNKILLALEKSVLFCREKPLVKQTNRHNTEAAYNEEHQPQNRVAVIAGLG